MDFWHVAIEQLGNLGDNLVAKGFLYFVQCLETGMVYFGQSL